MRFFHFSGTAQYKTPIFRIVNSIDGKYLTAKGAGQQIVLADKVDDNSQKW